ARAEGARRSDPGGSRPAALRPENRARASRDRRAQLRRNWIFPGNCGRDGEVPPGACARGSPHAIEGRMTLLTCATVRRRLPAFYDRELPISELIEIESHVTECRPCA